MSYKPHKINLKTKRTTGQDNQVIYDFKIIGYEANIDLNNYRIVGCHNILTDSSEISANSSGWASTQNSTSGSLNPHIPNVIHYNSTSRPPRRYDTFTDTEVRCKYNIEINYHLSANNSNAGITGSGGSFKNFGYGLIRDWKDFLDRNPNNNDPLKGQAALNAGYSHSTDNDYEDNDSFILEHYDSGVWKKVRESTGGAGADDPYTGKYPYDDIYENTPLASQQHSIGVDTTYDHKYIAVSGDTYIDKENPTTNYGTANTFGYRTNSLMDKRGMFKFDITNNFSTETIKHAEMWNFIKNDTTVAVNTSLDCRQLSLNWSDTSATYTNAIGTFPTTALDTIDYSGAGTSVKKTFSMFSLPTTLIETWKVEADNYGVGTVLTDTTSNGSTTYATTLSASTVALERRPRLIVTFTDTASGEKIWHGYQSNLWSNGNNWSTSAAIPQPSETVIFDSTVSNNDCLLDVDTLINGLSANTYTGSLNLSSYTLSVKTDAYLEHLTNLETSASTLKFTDTGVATLSSNTFYNLEFAGNTGLSGSNTSQLATEVSNNLTVGGTLNIGNDNNGSGVHDLKLLSGSTMNSSNGIITGDGRLYIVDDVLLDTTGTLSNYAIHYVSSAANVTVMSGDYSDVSIVQLINDDSTPHIFEFQGGIHKYTYLDAGLGNNTDVAGTIISLSANSPSVSASTMDVRNNAVMNHVQFFIGDTDFLCNSLLSTSGTKTISASGGRIILGGEDTFNNFQGMDNVIETDLVFEDGSYTLYGTTSPAPSNEAVIKANNITVSGSSTNTPILNFLHVDTLSAVNDIIVSGGPSTFTNLQGSKLAAGNNIKFIGQGNAPTTRLNMDPTSTWYQDAGNKIWAWYAAIQNAVNIGTSVPSDRVVDTSIVSTFAGTGSSGDTNGAGASATFHTPSGVVIDVSGNLYVVDQLNHKIRKISPAGVVSTFAGSGSSGATNDVGTAASFNQPRGLAIDASGNIYVADSGNNKIRKITSAGVVSTLAGTGSQGSNDGVGSSATFDEPYGVAVDTAGNVYVADTDNNKIRKISTSGDVSTLAGSGSSGNTNGVGTAASFNQPRGLAVDTAGNVYVADYGNDKIRKITPSGAVSTFAGFYLFAPHGLAIDASGNIYVVDSDKIRKISPSGDVSTLAGVIFYGSKDKDGDGLNASFNEPYGVAVDASGNLYVADTNNHKIRKIVFTQTISCEDVSTFAGTGGTGDANGAGASATFHFPAGLVVDASDNIYVADSNSNKIRKISPSGDVSTFAGSGSQGDTDGVSSSASFRNPYGLAIDASGNIYVADANNYKIRKINPSGVVSTLAGSGSYGDTEGLGSSASFKRPEGLAVDSSGNIYVSDRNGHKIRKISPAGLVSTLAGTGSIGDTDGVGSSASFNYPRGIAIDSSDNIYVADEQNHKIRMVTPSGVVSTFAGTGSQGSIDGAGASATFFVPYGVALDSSGNVYVAEYANHKIRKITPSGVVSTFAGSGREAFSLYDNPDGPANSAIFNTPYGLAVDSSDNVYVSDFMHNKIRKIQSIAECTIVTSANAAATDDLGGNTNWFFENDRNNLTDGAIVTVDQTTKRSGSPITLSFTATDTQTGITSSDISIDLDPLIGAIVPGSFNYAVANELTFNVEISAVTPTATDIEVTTINGSQLTATDTFGPYDYNTTPGTISFQQSVPSYGIKNDEISVLIFADHVLGFPLGGPATVFYGEYNGQVVSFNNFYIEDTTRAVVDVILPATTETISGNLSISATNIEGTTFTGDSSAVGESNLPRGITIDSLGNVYVADTNNHKIRKITPAGVVSTIAGNGSEGDVDGMGASSTFNEPSGVVLDSLGNIYVTDRGNYKIRKITPSGMVSTFAGSGSIGGTDGLGTAASFYNPEGITIDSSNNIYVTDTYNHKIRKITSAGDVTTLAGTGSWGYVDGAGNTAKFKYPVGITIDSSNNIYVADFGGNRIRKITPSGDVSTIAGTGITGSNNGAGTSATFNGPEGITIDSLGHVYVADTNNHKIRRIDTSNVVSNFVGTGVAGSSDGLGTTASFKSPRGLAIDSLDNVYVADTNNNKIRKITPFGVVSTLFTGGKYYTVDLTPPEVTFTHSPTNQIAYHFTSVNAEVTDNVGFSSSFDSTITDYYFIDSNGVTYPSPATSVLSTDKTLLTQTINAIGDVSTFAGTGTNGSTDGTSATFNKPRGVDFDASGNVYVADTYNHKIRKITPSGDVSTLAGGASPGYNNGAGASARFRYPNGVAVDSLGNIYVADTYNHTIRMITPSGDVSTFAGTGSVGDIDGAGTSAKFSRPHGITIDSAGNIYVADTYNSKIRKITPSGDVSTFAGTGVVGSTDGTSATFNGPTGVATDSAGNIYVADKENSKIRMITPSGVVSTLAGTGIQGDTNGPGTSATFARPTGVAVDNVGNVYVADTYGMTIRTITPSGVVSTLAGDVDSIGGDVDGMGTIARFQFPYGVAIDSSDNIYVADTGNEKIRKILVTPEKEITTCEFEISASGTLYLTLKDTAGNITTCADDGYITGQEIIIGTPSPSKVTPIDTNIVVPISAFGTFTDNKDNYYAKLLSTNNDEVELFWSDVTSPAINVNTFNVTLSGNDKLVGSVVVSGGVLKTDIVSTFAGTGVDGSNDGVRTLATFTRPNGVAVDSTGNVYVADSQNNKIRKIDTNGIVSTFASVGYPAGLITDSSDSLYVTDTVTNKILKITPSGVVSTVAGDGSYGSVDGPATSASFIGPNDIAMDSLGNIYVADTFNCNIRKIDTNNVVSTIAGNDFPGGSDGTGTSASFFLPFGIALDSSDNVYVADTNNNKIRKITPLGVVSTFAGTGSPGSNDGTGSAATFNQPFGVDVDSSDNIYVSDAVNNKIRKITPSGVVSTIAGTGSQGDVDGLANTATFNYPIKVVVDSSDNVYVADNYNHKIRKIVIDS
jgi:streptogramin lyase